MEVIEDRAERGSTLIATQIPLKQWHEAIGDPNQADAICDRILHSAHRITLKGASLRKTKAAPKEKLVELSVPLRSWKMASSILEVHEAVFVQTDLTPRLGTTLYLSHLVLTRAG